ncbi:MULTISPECIES: hypothetical protein [Comamonadaceae]|uniref:hypothetical protein n=1 Tax=Acidovorax sacchari TaxID=3230736 RepID=UPI0034A4BE73
MMVSFSDTPIAPSGGRNDCLPDGAGVAGRPRNAIGRHPTDLTARGEDRAPLTREWS